MDTNNTIYSTAFVNINLNYDTIKNINTLSIKILNSDIVLNNNEIFIDFLTNYSQILRCQPEVFILDIDTVDMSINKNIVGIIKAFAEANQMLFDCIEKKLLCSTIRIASPNVKVFINSILNMFYKPKRPLIFYVDNKDVDDFIDTCINTKNEILKSKSIEYSVLYNKEELVK